MISRSLSLSLSIKLWTVPLLQYFNPIFSAKVIRNPFKYLSNYNYNQIYSILENNPFWFYGVLAL